MNILITSASRKVSLVRSFQSALAQRGRGAVIAVDTNPCSAALYLADKHFLISPSSKPNFIGELLQLCQREHVQLVIPTRDEELPLFAENRSLFEQAGIRMIVAGAETVRVCQDKSAFVDFCQEHKFGIPRTHAPDQLREADFPLFVKPRFGKGSSEGQVVRNQAALSNATRENGEWVIQEYVDEPEYSLDVFCDFSSRVLSVVPRLRELVLHGESYVSRTVDEPLLIREAARLASQLRLVGHNTIQCFFNGKQVKFVEVNPRFGGAAALGIAAGADTPAMLLRLLDGEKISEGFAKFETNLVMLRYTEDLFLNRDALAPSGVLREPPPQTGERNHLHAVLFDLDNTLYPEEEFVVSGFRAAASCLAKHIDANAETLFQRMIELLHAHGRRRVFNALLAEQNLNSEVWLRVLLLAYRSHQPAISLFPEAATVLATLRTGGLRLGIVTDGAASVQRRKISALHLERLVDVIVCTDELGAVCAKPSTIPFEVALTLLGVAPSSAAYVADDETKDFAGPNRLGMRSLQIQHSGLIGVRRKPMPEDAIFRPQLAAQSLTEALTRLGIE